jgi:carbon-monoxide dehydrogenase small subunit
VSEHRVQVTVNGEAREALVPAHLSLADMLRDKFGLTGTHLGCEQGVCGACSVIVDGEAARSCTVLAVSADGAEIETVEGLADTDGTLTVLQAAFQKEHGLQCGFCTTGFLMSLTPLLEADERPSTESLEEALEGVVCRCTGYVNIRASVLAAVEETFGPEQSV